MSAVEVRDLRVEFPAADGWRAAVDGVTVEAPPGGSVGIVGESGSGKTLTALALLGLVPEPGRLAAVRLRVGELDVAGAGARDLARLRGGVVGLVPQEPLQALNPVRRVDSQVGEAARLHRGLGRRAAREEAERLLAEVGIAEPRRAARSYPHELSGGQRQRALVAAALAGSPSVLVADEPTSALDTVAQLEIVDLLARERRARSLTLLLVSHDLALVARACERVVVVHAGETVESGPSSDLLSAPLHPYTAALLESLPARGGSPISGRVPQAAEWGAGCRFVARCALAAPSCRAERPVLVDAGGSRSVRCHLRAPGGQA